MLATLIAILQFCVACRGRWLPDSKRNRRRENRVAAYGRLADSAARPPLPPDQSFSCAPGSAASASHFASAKRGLLSEQWPRITGYDERMSEQKPDHLLKGGIFELFDAFGAIKRRRAPGVAPVQ